jgi:hypothetical protein
MDCCEPHKLVWVCQLRVIAGTDQQLALGRSWLRICGSDLHGREASRGQAGNCRKLPNADGLPTCSNRCFRDSFAAFSSCIVYWGLAVWLLRPLPSSSLSTAR